MEETPQNPSTAQDDPQTAKLRLEIATLKKRLPWEPYLNFIPLVTALVPTAALMFSFLQFQTSQQAEQAKRVSSQIQVDKAEILKFGEDKKQTLSKVAFLFGDLKIALTSEAGDKIRASIEQQDSKRAFTKALVSLITRDLDFDDARDIVFPNIARAQWDDYQDYLKENPGELKVILKAYVNALRSLDLKNPKYVQTMKYHVDTGQYIVVNDVYKDKEGEKPRFRHFQDILDGFTDQLPAADSRPDVKTIKTESIRDFSDILCNEVVARKIFAAEFIWTKCMG